MKARNGSRQEEFKSSPDDLRAVLPELVAAIRNSPLKVPGFFRAGYLGVIRGLEFTRRQTHPELRRSYFISLAFTGLALLAEWLALVVAATTDTLLLPPLLATSAWFVLGAVVFYSQLSLVRSAQGVVYRRFGVPNALTLFRFLNIPLLIAIMPYFPTDRGILTVGTAVYAIAVGSDILDGNWARLSGRTSEFGRIWDPACDILINAGVCFAAWAAGYLPGFYVLLAELRFFLPVIGSACLYTRGRDHSIRPSLWGKLAVFIYALFIALILLRELTRAPFMADLTVRFLWVSVFFLVFNIVVIFERGMTLLRKGED